MPDLEKQKQEFLTLCRENIKRDGLEDLLGWLQKSDFFTAPASTRYHGAYEGGLCEHSLDVYHMAKKAIAGYELELTEESVVVATLFHDLCKVNFYKKDVRNQKINGTWQEVPCYTIEEKYCFGGHGSKSVYLVQQFMKLKTDEAAAINCHMGATSGGDSVRGFPYRSIGPEDYRHDNYGGQTMYIVTAELSHPIYSIVRGALFVDIGDAGPERFQFRTVNMGIGYGFGGNFTGSSAVSAYGYIHNNAMNILWIDLHADSHTRGSLFGIHNQIKNITKFY